MPVPLRLTVCGLVGSLSEIVIVAVRVPFAFGANETASVHDPAPLSDAPQLFVTTKSLLFAPVTVTLEIVITAELAFVSVTFRGGLFEPTGPPGNASEAGEAEIAATPVPVSETE